MKKIQKILTQVVLGLCIVMTISCNQKSKKQSDSLEPVTDIPTKLPYSFKSNESEQLCIEAFNLKKAGQFDKAIELYKNALHIEPDNPKLFFDMSDCYARNNNLLIAVQLLDTAITLDRQFAPFYNNRGLYNYKLNNNQAAINDYTKAIELDPQNYVCHVNMAFVYYSINSYSEACAEFKLAVSLGMKLDDLEGQPEIEKLKSLCK